MLSMITNFFGDVWAKIAAIGALVVAALSALAYLFFSIKKAGVQEQENADLTKGIKNVEDGAQVAAAVANMSDTAVDTELRKHYSRD